MADEGDKSGSNGAGGSGGGGALTPYVPQTPVPAPQPWFPAPYAPPMYLPLPAAADKSELKLSDSTPAQVRAELGWLVSTVKQNRMPIGVLVTCHRLLLLILHDLEARYRPPRPFLGSWSEYKRLKALQKVGAITRSVVDEANLLELDPHYRRHDYSALLGDPSEATRYVHFLKMLVEVAYEAQAKYRKAQQPAGKSAQGMAMTVTVGPQGGGG
jgi:hypothetical protein